MSHLDAPGAMTSLARRVLDGETRGVARALRLVDDRVDGYTDILKEIFPHTGKAYILGITGNPGAGKSTLSDRIIEVLRAQGRTVGVIAVDPSSPYSGGAILGDRIRMQRHTNDPGVFIRSVATRGQLGGTVRPSHQERLPCTWQTRPAVEPCLSGNCAIRRPPRIGCRFS